MRESEPGTGFLPQRRDLLIGAAGLALTTGTLTAGAAHAQTRAKLTPPPSPTVLPKAWTTAPVIPLWPDTPPGGAAFKPQPLAADWPVVFLRNTAMPTLHVFRPRRPNGAAILLIPGGAYLFVSVSNEGVDMAARLNPLGYTVFVLNYRLPSEGWSARSDVPLQDAQRAMRLIRARAATFGVDPAKLAVLGFSAGGHLAATLATGHAERVYEPRDAADALDARPVAAGLIYPVITMAKPYTHDLSRKLLLGDDAPDSLVARRSPERHVDATTPPVFLVHAIDDAGVPVENSELMLAACRAAHRPVEAHLLQEGDHAFGVGYPHTPSSRWIGDFDLWLGRNLTA